MTETCLNKLSIEEADKLAEKFSAEDTKAHYKQLADAMRENERLKEDAEEIECLRLEEAAFAREANSQIKQLRSENEELRKALESVRVRVRGLNGNLAGDVRMTVCKALASSKHTMVCTCPQELTMLGIHCSDCSAGLQSSKTS